MYGESEIELLQNFVKELDSIKENMNLAVHPSEWFKDAVVYSLYVDLFSDNFKGLTKKLDYLTNLGINCIWLLPVLESPMLDAGFDISNYKSIRKDLSGLPFDAPDEEHDNTFVSFLNEAHKRGIKVIFDIAINHTSVKHPWFQESRKSTDSPYRDYYIWNKDEKKYVDCRLIFKGMCNSNWEKDGEWYFFHRFFEHQPDLNYKNPKVLIAMAENLVFWLMKGVDGFRADAIPYLWKEEGTDCENLPKTHTIVKFFRAVLDYIHPGTLLLAEACQPPKEVVKYFGNSDECHAGYHFPLMPQIYKSLGTESAVPIQKTLSPSVTPAIPLGSQWFTFLRCHDELSLERVYVTEEDRKYIHETFCHKPEWNFREGEGISARLSDILQHDPNRILLAFSIMLTLPGTPIIYYGDEFGKTNDHAYYQEKIAETGHDDTRFLVRGKIDWVELEVLLKDQSTNNFKIFNELRKMIGARKAFRCFGRGTIEWLPENDSVLAFTRSLNEQKISIFHNLSCHPVKINHEYLYSEILLSHQSNCSENSIKIDPYGYCWLIH